MLILSQICKYKELGIDLGCLIPDTKASPSCGDDPVDVQIAPSFYGALDLQDIVWYNHELITIEFLVLRVSKDVPDGRA